MNVLALGRRHGLTLCSTGAAILVIASLGWIVGDVARHGLAHLDWTFLTSSPTQAGRSGGIAPILVSTAWIVAIAMAVALPLGLATALYLAEFARRQARHARTMRRSLDVLAGVPSIVFGLFGNVFFCHVLGLGFSLLSGGLTLACMVLPILIRATEQGLRSVPDDLRLGAAALGISQTKAFARLYFPVALPAVLAGVILGFGRAIAETAALIFTSGYVDRMPTSSFDSGRSLSVHIYDLAMNVPGGDRNAYATSLTLVGLLVITSTAAAYLAMTTRRHLLHSEAE